MIAWFGTCCTVKKCISTIVVALYLEKIPAGGLRKWASEGLQLVSYCEGVVGGLLGTRRAVVTPGVDGRGS